MTDAVVSGNDDLTSNPYPIIIEDGTRTDFEILFYAISGFTVWIFCTIFAWILSGYITRNKKRLSYILIFATFGVILFSWLDGFIVFIFKTNVFISDAKSVMIYQCSRCLNFTAICYGLYRYSLYIFYLIRIRHFFRGTAHEFRKQKFIASFIIISIISFCLISVLIFYIRPRIISSADNNGKYMICSGKLNDELREEILIFLICDVFISLYLTWLFVIKSRALLALENANQNVLQQQDEDDEDDEENDEDDDDDDDDENEEEPLTNNNNNDYGIDNTLMPTTYFIDELNGGLKSKSVRKLMLRCIYFGMLAMMTTWIHLALRFIEYINISCIETLINSLCVVLSFDITSDGYFELFCWCGINMGHQHGYGRNIRKKKRKNNNNNKENNNDQNNNNNMLQTISQNNDLSNTD